MHYNWVLEISQKEHQIDFFASKVSGKRLIKLDGEIKFRNQYTGRAMKFLFKVDNTELSITDINNGKYNLFVNGIQF